MPTKRRASHASPTESDLIDGVLTTLERTCGWLAVLAAGYLLARAFIPFLLALWTGGRP